MQAVDLRKSTQRLFNECAGDYLKKDRHWGCDLDVIVKCANEWPDVSVVELGSGYCWHLANLFFLTSSRIRKAVGIDYSVRMIDRAKHLLSSVKHSGESLMDRVDLIEGNILEVPLKSSSFQLVMLLNNTLGNLAGNSFAEAVHERRKALVEARRLLVDDGCLVVTLYNAAQIHKESAYGDVFQIDRDMSDFEKHDLVVRYMRTSTPCYSHWFMKEEAHELLVDCGFEVLISEVRLQRLVFVCRKKDVAALPLVHALPRLSA